MATLQVPIPDALAQEIADAFWTLCPPPEPPEGQAQITKAQNVVRMLRFWLKRHVMEMRERTAKTAADTATVETAFGA